MLDNIILIGFMGCGKTTFGTWIAKNKKMDFCDTDALIVEKEKKSINDVKCGTLASSDLPRRETTRGTIAYRKNRKLGKPSTHD